MPTILLIRHGESQTNAGLPTSNPKSVELTERGKEQAQNVVDFLKSHFHPDLIVTSAYERTKQTALPTKSFFWPYFVEEEWDVQEFTYLSSWHKVPSTVEDRREYARQYWELSDPKHIDAPESEPESESKPESFEQFIARAQKVMIDLKNTIYDKVAVFSHQQFLCALLWLSQQDRLKLCPDTMRNFKEFLAVHPIPNGGIVRVQFEQYNDNWQIERITSHLKSLEPAMARK